MRFCMQCATRLTAHRGHGVKECRRCGWAYWNNPKPSASVMIVEARKILLARRAVSPYRGYWDAIGGFIEPGESAEQAIKREVREELGVDVKLDGFLGTFAGTYGRGGIATLDVCYIGRLADDAAKIRVNDDVASVAWIPINRLPPRLTAPSRNAVRRLTRMIQKG